MNKTPRDFHVVIKKVLELIPDNKDNTAFRNDLVKIQKDAYYTAPEIMSDRWYDSSLILEKYLPIYELLNGEWQKPLVDLWMNKA